MIDASGLRSGTPLSLKFSGHLPKFERPPVVETVLGVQFHPLPNFTNGHLGLFWKRLGSDWPFAADVLALEPQFEQFADPQSWVQAGILFKVSQEVGSRLQIRNKDHDRMIQVQNGRLFYNWLGQGGGNYAGYKIVRPAFNQALKELERFLVEELKGDVQPNQWEVTYVNHLPKGTVWNSLEDCAELFRMRPLLQGGPSGTLLEDFGGEWHYEIPPKRGRLHVQLKHGKLPNPGGSEGILLTLTARGPIGEVKEQGSDLDTGLNLGHEVIVRAFYDLTAETAHEFWGLKHAT
jgi:uncharacterized protein (TIGR04255 family)